MKPTASAYAKSATQYARGTRVSYALANWIRSQGYNAQAYPGPSASALLLIPPAIASGLGELGKHGSLINRQYGAGLRLAGVTTDMPLVATQPDRFGADEFCTTCQVCTNACPPGAINEQKQMVRGVERWYVDFDKCIPFFAEAASCAICIAECPWTRPSVRPKAACHHGPTARASQTPDHEQKPVNSRNGAETALHLLMEARGQATSVG